MTGTYATIIEQNLYGLRGYPVPFPSHIWNDEFRGEDVDTFKKAVGRVRSTSPFFPTYSEVRDLMRTIRKEETPLEKYPEISPEELTESQKRRAVFHKWYEWLKANLRPGQNNDEVLLRYYEGCARDYTNLGGNYEYKENVNELWAAADKIKKRIEARSMA